VDRVAGKDAQDAVVAAGEEVSAVEGRVRGGTVAAGPAATAADDEEEEEEEEEDEELLPLLLLPPLDLAAPTAPPAAPPHSSAAGRANTAQTLEGCGIDCISSPPLQTKTDPSSAQLTSSSPPLSDARAQLRIAYYNKEMYP
jgi:hypothetical protein